MGNQAQNTGDNPQKQTRWARFVQSQDYCKSNYRPKAFVIRIPACRAPRRNNNQLYAHQALSHGQERPYTLVQRDFAKLIQLIDNINAKLSKETDDIRLQDIPIEKP